MEHIGLKKMRGMRFTENDGWVPTEYTKGPVDANKYWGREARPKCSKCRGRMRSTNHECKGRK